MTREALRIVWRYVGVGWLALVAYLSLASHPPGAAVLPTDAGHFVAYAWLMMWFGQLRTASRERAMIAAGLVLYGIAIEFAQRMTPLRQFSLADMAINAAGVTIGAALLWTRLGTTLDRLAAALARR